MIVRGRGVWPHLLASDVVSDGAVALVRQPLDRPFLPENLAHVCVKWSRVEDLDDAARKASGEMDRIGASCGGFAWDAEFGYVTSVLAACGTGLTVSALFHLEALHLVGDLPYALNGLEAMRLAAVPLCGGGFQQAAHLFSVSNASTLGISEETLCRRMRQAFAELVHQELNARIRLVRETPLLFEDAVERALAVLQRARLLSEWELLDVLSPVRIAAEMGFLENFTRHDAEKMTRERMFLPDDPPPESTAEEDALDRRDHALATRMNKRFADVRLNARAKDVLS